MWWDCLSQMCNITHMLLVIRKHVTRLPFTNVQWHSHAVGHEKRCDEIAFHKCAISPTNCWSEERMWWHCLSQNMQCYSLPVGHSNRCNETAFHKNLQSCLHTVSHRGKYMDQLVRNICNVTYLLFEIGKHLWSRRLSFEPLNQHDMLLTFYHCWYEQYDVHKALNITHPL